MAIRLLVLALLLILDSVYAQHCSADDPSPGQEREVRQVGEMTFESVALVDGGPKATLSILYTPDSVEKHPVVLMMGSINPEEPPYWSQGLLKEGYMLVAFSVAHPPNPDPAKRPQWLVFDQRFAHGYILDASRVPHDAQRVVDYLDTRGDVHPRKIGWMGSSSTGIPGLAVATQGPRLAAVVAFVSTGAYRQWFETWHTNNLWSGETNELWPETLELLEKYDSILHADGLYPTAVLMVSGGADGVVDPKTAQAFVEAARPNYKNDESRLRLVVYDGFGHNLPLDIVTMYIEHWFHLYMHPAQQPPEPQPAPENLQESVTKTQINATDHKDIIGAE